MRKLLSWLAFLFLGFPAQAQAQDVCQTLAANLKQDVLIQGSSSEVFQSFQQIIRETKYSDYNTAKNTSFGGDLNIVEYVDLTINSKSDESNWGTNRQTFLNITFSSLSSSARNSIESHRTNVQAVQAIAECATKIANRQGFYVQLADVGPGRDSFSINFINNTLGNSGFEIRDFSILPPNAGVTCTDGVARASSAHPYRVSGNSLAVSCAKPADRAVTVTINTSRGSGGPFTIGSVNDQWKKITERIEALERSSVPAATVAFFDAVACPAGWTFDDRVSGRYIVGLNEGGTRALQVGTKLSDGENRATGEHTHPFTAFGGPGRGGEGAQGGRDNFTRQESNLTTGSPSGSVPGTNAPYIQLRACKKD